MPSVRTSPPYPLLEGLPPPVCAAQSHLPLSNFPAFPSSSSDVPDLTNAINRRSQSTQQLLIKFLELSEKGARASSDELRERSAAEHKKVGRLSTRPTRTFLQREGVLMPCIHSFGSERYPEIFRQDASVPTQPRQARAGTDPRRSRKGGEEGRQDEVSERTGR